MLRDSRRADQPDRRPESRDEPLCQRFGSSWSGQDHRAEPAVFDPEGIELGVAAHQCHGRSGAGGGSQHRSDAAGGGGEAGGVEDEKVEAGGIERAGVARAAAVAEADTRGALVRCKGTKTKAVP